MGFSDSKSVEHLMAEITRIFTTGPDWIQFHKAVLGPSGLVRKTFSDGEELARFEQTQEYKQIGRMLESLRGESGEPTGPDEPLRVMTIRLPRSVHAALKDEAYRRHTSVNKLCITKLLEGLDLDAAARGHDEALDSHPRERPLLGG